MQPKAQTGYLTSVRRIKLFHLLIIVVTGIFIVRLFYLQVIRHDYYANVAQKSQLKQYEIPARRGVIEAHNGDQVVPIVLNEVKYTLYADPKLVADTGKSAEEIQKAIGGNAEEYKKLIETKDTRYVVLSKKLSEDQSNKVLDLKLKGINTHEAVYRTYPQGSLAAQMLGFVNNENEGKYGLEEALNDELKGTPGLLKAVTDAKGVPLASQKDNVLTEPQDGSRLLLTVDMGLQQQLEDILKQGLDRAVSKSGSALIMDVKTGEIKAMANYPTYSPADFSSVEDASLFTNAAVSSPLEVGSIMKPLTAAAAIDKGLVTAGTTYFDPGVWTVDEAKITNIEEAGGAANRSVQDIITLSLNTGATWLLMQMGGGQVNEQARNTWHDYMTNRYQLGKLTGIEQGYEAAGSIPDPNDGFGLNIQFANSSFGQGMTATPLQMASAMAGAVNGGTYYKPHLIDKITKSNGEVEDKQPEIVKEGIISKGASDEIRNIMVNAFNKNFRVYGMSDPRSQYMIGSKTGTAQIARPEGGYYEDRFNGTFAAFVGGNEPQYIVVVRVNEPKIGGYAGARAAAPIGANLINLLIDNYGVTPKN